MPGSSKTYTMPVAVLEGLLDLGMSYADARSSRDGTLSSWIERNRFERGGLQWVTLQERGQGYAAEIAIDANGDVADVTPLAPERARELDA